MTRKRPLVAVTSDVKDMDGYRWHATPDQYLRAAIHGASVLPLIVPSLGPDIDLESLLAQVDGVLVTGSRANVHPSHYGVAETVAHEPFDHNRDATTLPLIRAALERGVPLLAICRGIQELNVALGGSLVTEIQTIEGRMDHRMRPSERAEEKFALAHDIRIREGSCLADVFGTREIKVNSLHRQAIDRIAPGLQVEAVAEDGTIEAVSVVGARSFAVGVQWHPEFWVGQDGPSNAIFKAFGEAVRAHQSEITTAEQMSARTSVKAATG